MSRIGNYPYLIGVSENGRKELRGVNEVAAFICEAGLRSDLKVLTPDGEEVLDTFGMFLNRVSDFEYRTELVPVLVPMQKAAQAKIMQKNQAQDSELDTLDEIFAAMKMDDIEVNYDERGVLYATDSEDNFWQGAELYRFILHEALAFDENGKLKDGFGIDEELIERVKEFAAGYDVYFNENEADAVNDEETEDDLDAELG